MTRLPTFDELFVISDLHIAPEIDMQLFDEHELLAEVVATMGASRTRRVGLCINGDMVDFLAARNAQAFDPSGAIEKLHAIVAGPSKPVWYALTKFVKSSIHELAITLGNHDLELSLPWVRDELLEILTGGDRSLRGRIHLAFDGSGFACRVGAANVLCIHGNDVDSWNLTDYERLRRIARDGLARCPVDAWVPNAGSQLVTTVMNELKLRYPFIDVLKPEREAVLPVLIALARQDPKFDGMADKIVKSLSVVSRVGWDKVRKVFGYLSENGQEDLQNQQSASRQRLMSLLTESASPAIEAVIAHGDPIDVRVEGWLRSGVKPMSVLQGRDTQRLGAFTDFFDKWRDAGKKQRVCALRRSLQSLILDQSFELGVRDETYKLTDQGVGTEIHFLITGHTHMERAYPRSAPNTYYFNSGAWARRAQFEASVLQDDLSFGKLFDVIMSGDRAAFGAASGLRRHPPVVVHIAQEKESVVGRLKRTKQGKELMSIVDDSSFAVE